MRTLNKTEEALLSAYRCLIKSDKDCAMVATNNAWIEIKIKPVSPFYLGEAFRIISVNEGQS